MLWGHFLALFLALTVEGFVTDAKEAKHGQKMGAVYPSIGRQTDPSQAQKLPVGRKCKNIY